MMLIDSHAHLIDEKFEDVDSVILRAFDAGVKKIITPTTKVEDFEKALELSSRYENVYTLLGVHPENLSEIKVDQIASFANRQRVVGIGEIGMDFYYDKEKKTKDQQMKMFLDQLQLALELNLPVAIHCREASEETKEALLTLPKMPQGQFHCFAGDEVFLEWVLENNFYVSFAGNVTFKNASNLREMMCRVPLDRLLLETDSPYLSPEPIRGGVNEPKNVKIIAELVAKVRGVEFDELAKKTSENAICLYCLEN